MKKVLKYSTILSVAALIAGTSVPATADTGGYVRIKGMESHFHSLGFREANCVKSSPSPQTKTNCKFASEQPDGGDIQGGAQTGAYRPNTLKWGKDEGEGIVAGADYGFFRLEIEGTYQQANAEFWRNNTVTGGQVHQGRLFANVVVEPLDLLELLGEFGGIDGLVKYNPAHYGFSPYALYGYGIMGGLVENLTYTKRKTQSRQDDVYAGGATGAVNVGAGVNIGLDKLARSLQSGTGASLPEYFKLPIEFSFGYHWQIGLDELLYESMDEDLGIDDGGITYSVGLKW